MINSDYCTTGKYLKQLLQHQAEDTKFSKKLLEFNRDYVTLQENSRRHGLLQISAQVEYLFTKAALHLNFINK